MTLEGFGAVDVIDLLPVVSDGNRSRACHTGGGLAGGKGEKAGFGGGGIDRLAWPHRAGRG